MHSSIIKEKEILWFHAFSLMWFKLLFNTLITRRVPHFLIVRNPYGRLLSFYKDKFIKNISSATGFQNCQLIFFPHLLSEQFEKIKAGTGTIPFSYFVQILPKVFDQDTHLHPQSWIEYMGPKWLGIKIHYEKVFDMDKDLEELKSTLNLALPKKENSTKEVEFEAEWTEEDVKIVTDIYYSDFIRFGYPIQPDRK